MHMVGHSACRDECAGMIPHDPADVLKKAWLHVGLDLGSAVFRAEYDVAVK
jgi:hypothetical protein